MALILNHHLRGFLGWGRYDFLGILISGGYVTVDSPYLFTSLDNSVTIHVFPSWVLADGDHCFGTRSCQDVHASGVHLQMDIFKNEPWKQVLYPNLL